MQGVSYDHVEMKFFINGRPVNARFTGIRGTVYPVIYGILCQLIHILLHISRSLQPCLMN